MPVVTNTRLRWIVSQTHEDLEAAINRLGFKVEIKSIDKFGSKWIIWFVIPDDRELVSFEV